VVAAEARRLLARLRHPAPVPFRHVAAPALADGTTAADLFGVVEGYATGVKARPGYFEQAHGGVLLLDEVGDTPLPEQAKLLAALQEREVLPLGGRKTVRFDCLVIGATNQDLASLVERRTLRDDLLDRLSRFVIDLQPLDHRKEDIPHIARALLRRHGFSGEMGWEVVQRLVERSYPGNVRELDALVERMVATAQLHGVAELDTEVLARASAAAERLPTSKVAGLDRPAAAAVGRTTCPPRAELLAALEATSWNKSEVGRRYGKDPRQIARWMEYAGITRPD
jgi:transcriptional regulator with GAF, ATPase, and Fis domain